MNKKVVKLYSYEDEESWQSFIYLRLSTELSATQSAERMRNRRKNIIKIRQTEKCNYKQTKARKKKVSLQYDTKIVL